MTVLDGDSLRGAASAGLGFSKEDRDTNVLRAAAAARAIVARGAIAVCALISPYRDTRAAARRLIGDDRFVEVFVDTPLAVCEARDPKGVYSRYRRGEVHAISGIDDPYEVPLHPDLVLETESHTPAENVHRVLDLLAGREVSD